MSILRNGHVALSNVRIKSPCCNSRVIQKQLIPGETGVEGGGGGWGLGGGGLQQVGIPRASGVCTRKRPSL